MKRFIQFTVFLGGIAVFNLSLAGENVWTSDGPHGGSIKTIAIHPSNSQILFIGTIHNGMYKSTDAGQYWQHVYADSMDSTLRKVVFHPFGPDTMYAATVKGIYKSTDSGISWRNISPMGREGREFRALALDPQHPNIILSGGPQDRWKSTDSGENWYPFIIENYGGLDHSVEALAINPENPNIVYVLTSDAEFGKGIFKSTDEGETWFCTHNNSDSSGFGTAISIDLVDPNVIYYARHDGFRQSVGGKFLSKSTDGGDNWSDISPQVNSEWGAFEILISPIVHNTLFLATVSDGVMKSTNGGQSWSPINNGLKTYLCASMAIDSTSGSIYLGTYRDGIYKSADEGGTWQKISYNIIAQPCVDLAFSAAIPPAVYVIAGTLCFKQTLGDSFWVEMPTEISNRNQPSAIEADAFSPQEIYLTSLSLLALPIDTAGFYFSENGGESWDLRRNDLPTDVIFDDIAISYFDISDNKIFITANYSPLFTSDGIYFSDNEGLNWSLSITGLPTPAEMNIVKVAPNDPNIIATSDYYNNIFISTARGESWSNTNYPHPGGEGVFIYDITFDPFDADIIYVYGLCTGIYKTTDLGNSWADITNDLPNDPLGSQIDGLIINPQNTQNMFVTSLGYGVFQTHNGGQHWEPFNSGLDSAFSPGKLYFVPGDTTRLYLATNGRSVWTIHRTLEGIKDKPDIPTSLYLGSYPNPFNAQTTISYTLPKASLVTIDVYDLLGRKLETLVNSNQNAGSYNMIWDASERSSGIYFCKIKAGEFSINRKMVLLK